MMSPISFNTAGSLNSARQAATEGLHKQGEKILTNTMKLIDSFNINKDTVPAKDIQNVNEAALNDNLTPPTVQLDSMVASMDKDVISPIIDMKTAAHAYQASAKALQVVNDVEREALNILK